MLALTVLFLYESVILTPDINKKPDVPIGSNISDVSFCNQENSIFNHQSIKCPKIIQAMHNPRNISILLSLSTK